jgi:hypothetical protein
MKTKFSDKVKKLKERLNKSDSSTLKVLTRPSFVSVVSIILIVVLVSGLSVFAINVFSPEKNSPTDGEVSYAEVITLLSEELTAYEQMKTAVELENERLRAVLDKTPSEISTAYSEYSAAYNRMRIVENVLYPYNVLEISSSLWNTYRSYFGSSYFVSSWYSFSVSEYQTAKAGLNLYETSDGEQILGLNNYVFNRTHVYDDTVYAVDLLYTYYTYVVTVYEAQTGILSNPNYAVELQEKYEAYQEAYALYQFYSAFNSSNSAGVWAIMSDRVLANTQYLNEIDTKMAVITAKIIELAEKVN